MVKVQFGDVNRRLVLQEPYTFKSLLQMVTSRFELNQAQALSAQLRYIDPDGDLISMNTDTELSEALALLSQSSQSEVQPLRMKLICPEVSCESPGSEDSVVLLNQMEQKFAGSISSQDLEERLKKSSEQAKLDEETLQEQVQAEAKDAAEKARMIALREEEAAHEAEERKRVEAELARVAAEEKARAAKIAAEEEEKARLQEEEEKRQRCEIAIGAEKEDSGKRIATLLQMGCSVDSLRAVFSAQLIDWVVAVGAAGEKRDSEHSEADRNSRDDRAKENEVYLQAPEPVVDWELQRALKEQESKGESFPSPQQSLAVLEAGQHAQDLATQLTEFYMIHNPEYVAKVPGLVKMYKNRKDELNRALIDRYRCDLNSFRDVAPIQTPVDVDGGSCESKKTEVCAFSLLGFALIRTK